MQVGHPRRKLVLLGLMMHADQHGDAWPAQDTLAAYAECSTRTVHRHLLALEEDGYIVRSPQPRDDRERFKTNRYRLAVDGQTSRCPTDPSDAWVSDGGESPSDISGSPSDTTVSDGPSDISGSPSDILMFVEGQDQKAIGEGHSSKANRASEGLREGKGQGQGDPSPQTHAPAPTSPRRRPSPKANEGPSDTQVSDGAQVIAFPVADPPPMSAAVIEAVRNADATWRTDLDDLRSQGVPDHDLATRLIEGLADLPSHVREAVEEAQAVA
jgi:DNA-binding HxlR family transcriptional regulator